MKYLGTRLMVAGTAAFITPLINVDLPEGLSIPTLPTDILGGVLLLAVRSVEDLRGLVEDLTGLPIT